MTPEQTLLARCESQCELCGANPPLEGVDVAPSDGSVEQRIMLCDTCRGQLQGDLALDPHHWRCLNDSMWSPVPAVQVMAWRQLRVLAEAGESWAAELLEMLYLDEATLRWAEATPVAGGDDSQPTLDSNGAILLAGDTVTLIKDLEVKGAGFTAKRGTAVRNISLTDNPEQIEGRVNGVRIVLLTKFLKKAN